MTKLAQLRRDAAQYLDTALSVHYDIERPKDDPSLLAVYAFHSRDARYVLVKRAELWAAEHHEYLYLYSMERLTREAAELCWKRMLEDGRPRVRPHAQHMYTYLTAVILYEQAEPEALEAIRRLKQRREFKLSLHGWMESRIAAVDITTAALTTNRAGKALKKDFGRLAASAITKCKERREQT
ncbi:MAG: hypothetical protein Q4C65_11835 [Eubacteriales bacterium]|nr:hypothetical protein [Eubacteriales bacterium]